MMTFGKMFEPFFGKLNPSPFTYEGVTIFNWLFWINNHWFWFIDFISLISLCCYAATMECLLPCVTDKDNQRHEEYIKHFCYVEGTYIVPEYLDPTFRIGRSIYPGVGQEFRWDVRSTTTRLYQSHYPFIFFVLYFQAISLAMIERIWRFFEGGRLKSFLGDLSIPALEKEKETSRINYVVKDVMISYPSSFFTKYAWYYILIEIFHICNIILQYFVCDWMMQYKFSTYGVDVIRYLIQDPPGYPNPLDMSFPKVAKCEIKMYGPSGSDQNFEALCIMPLNNFSEKLFIVIWFWMAFLAVISTLGVLYRVTVLFSTCTRYAVLRLKAYRSSGIDFAALNFFTKHSSYGKWYFVSYVQKNVTPPVFANFIKALVHEMKELEGTNS